MVIESLELYVVEAISNFGSNALDFEKLGAGFSWKSRFWYRYPLEGIFRIFSA